MDRGVKRRLRNSAGSARGVMPLKEPKEDGLRSGPDGHDGRLATSTPPRISSVSSTNSTASSHCTRSRRLVEISEAHEVFKPIRRTISTPRTGSVTSVSVASPEDKGAEILVRTDAMDLVMDSHGSRAATPPEHNSPAPMDSPFRSPKQPFSEAPEDHDPLSYPRSMSVLSDQSDLSSVPSSVSSKATTPVDLKGPNQPDPITRSPIPSPQPVIKESRPPSEAPTSAEEAAQPEPRDVPARPAKFRNKPGHNRRYEVRPRVSISSDIASQEYAIQCIAAAESSRLNPYALHPDEYLMLRDHISQAQITTYLNLRNGILRLWVRNPTFSITREEAVGCAKDSRWFDVANVCFDFLVREGYINFGCCEVRPPRHKYAHGTASAPLKRKTIVVIGAGISGLGCARQLEGLFAQYARKFRERGEQPPKVVVLEGRRRVGGRVYSRPFRAAPSSEDHGTGQRCTAEMGGMIITGFDRGNPINILIRGQLGLGCHALRSDISLVKIYDTNGKPFDSVRDMLIDKLYNHCIERVAEYKWKLPLPKLLEGKRDLIDEGKDSWAEVHKTISYVEEMAAAQPQAPPVAEQNIAPRVDLVPVSSDRATGRVHLEPGTPAAYTAAHTVKMLGWTLKEGVGDDADVDLEQAANAPGATFGSVLDEAIVQFKNIVDLSPQDMRMFNWHVANLEYSNATNVHQLSLKGWDIDMGNEWEGKHTMVVGGYQSLAFGLAQCPTPLDIQYNKVVRAIRDPASGDKSIPPGAGNLYKIELEDGTIIDADYVVNTIPLGVLKHGDITFDPPLPSWKTNAIDRLGFGVLNKVILVYDQPFWEQDKDIFGVLRSPQTRASHHPKDYSSGRGRFFQWFNVTNTSGMPALLALMAGDAAYDTEKTPNDDLVAEATQVLSSIFGRSVPNPTESIVTRWASDRFARGSYSSAGPKMQLEDYDLMSRPIGRLFFAGEHTSATHPATVHGAYMTGLRAASEVLNDMLGPIEVQTPLIVPKEMGTTSALLKRKSTAEQHARDPLKEAEEAWQVRLWDHQRSVIGGCPPQPAKCATKAHLLFTKDHSEAARQRCLEGRRPGKGPPTAHEVRAMAGKMWTAAPEEERRPYIEQVALLKEANSKAMAEWLARVTEYNRQALEIAAGFEPPNPKPESAGADVKYEASVSASASVSAAASPAGKEARRAQKVAVEKMDEGDDRDLDVTMG